MRWRLAAVAVFSSGLLALSGGLCYSGQLSPVLASETVAATPRDASYMVAGEVVHLNDGVAEWPAAPGSAAKVRTEMALKPVHGDLDGDGDKDAVLWLVQQTGGSGSFYYLAAALRESGGFRGTTATFLGDRIAPASLSLVHRVVTARFARRREKEPMATPPTLDTVRYYAFASDSLVERGQAGRGEALEHGWLVYGHEVRSFQPCSEAAVFWLSGEAAAIRRIAELHRRALPESASYAPLFVSLLGRRTTPPMDGFGADYDGGFVLARVVQAWPAGNCSSDRVLVERPLPGSRVASPLRVRGRAISAWFFEGEVGLRLLDDTGRVRAHGFATAESPSRREAFVPFSGALRFESQADFRVGYLIVERNNPSDDRSLDESLIVPIAPEP